MFNYFLNFDLFLKYKESPFKKIQNPFNNFLKNFKTLTLF
jgi:hypothetical protein